MKILGYNYKMNYKAKKNMYHLGENKSTSLQMNIRKKQSPQQTESTILHEMIHALSYHLKLDLEERQVMSLEAGLYQALTENGVDLSPLTKELTNNE